MDLLFPLLAFVACVLGGGLVAATFFRAGDPLERYTLGLAAHLLALFVAGFALHIVEASHWWWSAWPALLAGMLWRRRIRAGALLGDADLRRALLHWSVFAAWAVGLLLCVAVYGGGYWVADWIEHYERARFWQLGGPADTRFLVDIYSLGARPPLANVIAGGLLELSGGGIPRHLILNTLLGSLIIFPAALLARKWAPGRATAAVSAGLLVLMCNPMVAQNLSFGWTRHFTSFWILLGAHLLWRGLASSGKRADRVLGFLCLACGFLAHYSAGPAIIVAVGAYVWTRRDSWRLVAFWRETALHAIVCGALLGLWFGWALLAIGSAETFGSNTSVVAVAGQTTAENVKIFALNLRDTLIPHPLRPPEFDPGFNPVPEQLSQAGRLRDFFFNIYQINLPLMFGFGGLAALLTLACRRGLARPAWLVAFGVYVALGVGVTPARDHLGLGHICLQPLVLLGLIRVAAMLTDDKAPALARTLWRGGAVVDMALGIVLQFGLQSLRFGDIQDYGRGAYINAMAGFIEGLRMPRFAVGLPDWVLLAGLLLSLTAAIRLRRLSGAATG